MLSVFSKIIAAFIGVLLVIVFIVKVQDKKYQAPEVIDDDEQAISLENLHIPELESSYRPVPDFASIANVVDKKKAFFAYLLPEIRRQNKIVMKEREMVLSLQAVYMGEEIFNSNEQQVFDLLKQKYKLDVVEDMPIRDVLAELIIRVDAIPEELILVQAANESGWGTSRFAQKGYNFFGLWCFKVGCGFVPKQRNDDAKHEVAKFRDLSHSVMTYIRNINRLYAYQELRQTRFNLRQNNQPVTAKALSKGLIRYSERGQEYIDELLSMLRVNEKYMSIAN